MTGWTRTLMLLGCLMAAGCSTTPTKLAYDPTQAMAAKQPAKALVEIAAVTDSRGEDPKWLGAIRGGYGNPIKILHAESSVGEVVKTGFADGLKARGLTGAASQYAMQIDIGKFDCSQYIRREAHAHIGVSLTDKASGRQAYQRQAVVDRVSGSFITLETGIFASVEDLRKLANDALQEAIDQTLDDPKFLALVR